MAPPSIIEGPDSPAVNGDKVFKPLEERPSKKAKTEAKGEFLLRITVILQQILMEVENYFCLAMYRVFFLTIFFLSYIN